MNSNDLSEVLKKQGPFFDSVVPFNALKDRLLLMDFTQENKELTPQLYENTLLFADYIKTKLADAGAVYGIGGYAENRNIYSRSEVFGSKENGETRRLHLGIDIWGKPNTKVMAPVDGMVHSFAFNSAFGDYGATIILSHFLEGISFYTLYGHLSLASITNLQEGERIKQGEVFAEFGIPQENGNWPPHLHFQIIKDLQDKKGDYPGVCKNSEREVYLQNCPDPDLILGMMEYAKKEN